MNKIKATARIARNEYQRRWRAKNKDKVQQYQIRYWEKKAEENQIKEAE